MTTKVLNLYAGIGGNRKLWEDVDVTAVEWDEEKAEVYRDHFPNDTVVVTDAHEYLKQHIFEDWGFIWASPPCPTHSCMQPMNQVQHGAEYPDMDLYEEIVLLRLHDERVGYDYCVENVQSYYEPLYEPQSRARHYFWANFTIPPMDMEPVGITGAFEDRDSEFDYEQHEEMMGYDLSEYDMSKSKKGKMLRNCVHPDLGQHVFEAATKNRQATLDF
jgi:DNA (cytosine-5)-methyltransferase 1